MTAIPPLRILQARAEARARLYAEHMMDLGEALDPLFEYAATSQLEEVVGPDAVIAIVRAAFLEFAWTDISELFEPSAQGSEAHVSAMVAHDDTDPAEVPSPRQSDTGET